MPWVLLITAVFLEVAWAISLRMTEGYTKLWPSIASIVFCAANLYILSLVFKYLPTSLAYPIWVGLGIVGTVLLSSLIDKSSVSLTQMLFIGAILIGVAGLKATA